MGLEEDVELAVRRARIGAAVRDGDGAAHVPALLRNLRDADPLPAPVAALRLHYRHVARRGIADLDEEVRLRAVKSLAVVERLLHERHDLSDGLWRFVGIGLEFD